MTLFEQLCGEQTLDTGNSAFYKAFLVKPSAKSFRAASFSKKKHFVTVRNVLKKNILATPVWEEEITDLRAGDIVYLNGEVYTARDKAHQRILETLGTDAEPALPIPKGAVLYHCGPLVRRTSTGDWEILAAGPTTSSRMEATTLEIIEKLRIRGIIGKGGMGTGTRTALQQYGCVYFAMTGGAAVLAATHIKAVEAVYWEDLGLAEAVWHLRVDDFGPLVVSMDAHGKSLYEEITEAAEKKCFDSFQPRTQ